MPELTVDRKNPAPFPMVCMYCGAVAVTKREWQVVNRSPSAATGGGSDLGVVPVGDDPVSAAVGLLLLPVALWELVKGISAALGWITRPRAPARPEPRTPPRDPHTTLVAVTTCERHGRFTDRFVLAGAGMLVALVALWVWAVLVTRRVMGTDDTEFAVALILTALALTALLPLVLSFWYAFGGPVIVERVTEETVVLDRVRQRYFDATGTAPSGPDR
ncbi:unnamed protein product [Gemmataceae bacterium]|nr:unnamed protein product [Gemmataceae bacterium]VTT98769.1 unnamed protein product [Gemmataceae bacterium]